MKPLKLPKLNKMSDTLPLEDHLVEDLPTNPNNFIKSSHDDLLQIINYLNTQEDDIKMTNTFYRKKNTHYERLTNLKKKFINPNNIIEEVKQKFDFHMRMKELSKKEDREDKFERNV